MPSYSCKTRYWKGKGGLLVVENCMYCIGKLSRSLFVDLQTTLNLGIQPKLGLQWMDERMCLYSRKVINKHLQNQQDTFVTSNLSD